MIGAAFPPRAPFLDCPVTTPRVLQSEDLDPAAAAWLRESCDLDMDVLRAGTVE